MDNGRILTLTGISKTFPGVKALSNLDMAVGRGSIHALVGENGAGKSTLIKILAGIYQPDAGTVEFDGRPARFRKPSESKFAGISVVHQELKLSETLSVAENIFLGNLMYKNRLVDWKAMRERSRAMLESLGIDIDVDETVENITVAKKQMVEICKAINHKCKLLIMDEPSATLTDKEQKVMFRTIRKLNAQGMSIIYISHRLEEIFDLADTVTVLCDGKLVITRPVEGLTRPDLIKLMVGRELTEEYPKERFAPGETVLSVKNLNRKGVLRDISFSARRGEVLGFAGLVGSGRTEVARAVLGIDKVDSGDIVYKGKPFSPRNFGDAVAGGFGLIPEDRKLQGLVLISSVQENISMVNMSAIIRAGVVRGGLERMHGEEYVRKLNISTPSLETEAQYLSGGNQQKIVVAKWLLQNSDVIFLDEPTRGIDVGAKAEIYLLINDLVRNGKVVIMISSELGEILGMSDRIVVMHEGRIAGELSASEATQEAIISMCV